MPTHGAGEGEALAPAATWLPEYVSVFVCSSVSPSLWAAVSPCPWAAGRAFWEGDIFSASPPLSVLRPGSEQCPEHPRPGYPGSLESPSKGYLSLSRWSGVTRGPGSLTPVVRISSKIVPHDVCSGVTPP